LPASAPVTPATPARRAAASVSEVRHLPRREPAVAVTAARHEANERALLRPPGAEAPNLKHQASNKLEFLKLE
jgi:hypothetical protein